MENRRQNRRHHVHRYVRLTERGTDSPVGRIMDISRKGMRLRSKCHIESDQVLSFQTTLPRTVGKVHSVQFDGKVRWCRPTDETDYHEAGISLKNVSDKDRDRIERFMLDSTFDSSSLRVAGCRSAES